MVSFGISDKNLQDIYSDSYISIVAHDNRQFEPIKHPLAKYVSAFKDGEFMGAFLIILFSKTEIEIHSLLKKSSLKYSRVLGEEVIDLVFNTYKPLRITANIIDGLEKAKNYVKKLGFSLEGIRKDACKKDREIVDVYMYGLTKKQWSQKWDL